MRPEVLTFGEGLLRLQPGGPERIVDAPLFHAWPGGAELNTTCALAGLGVAAAWFSLLPHGPLGDRILRHVRAFGVDGSFVRRSAGRLGTYWVEYGREPRAIEVHYDRKGSTVCEVRREDVPWDALRGARAFFVSGITPALSANCRDVCLAMAAEARAAGVKVFVDLNYRARLWTAVEAAPVLEGLARSADVVIATAEDLDVLFGLHGEAEGVLRAARERLETGTLVLTRGAEGAVSLDGTGLKRAAGLACHPIDRIGAGDAFSAGFLFASLTGRHETALEHGLALAALKHTMPGDAVSASLEDVERVLARGPGGIRR